MPAHQSPGDAPDPSISHVTYAPLKRLTFTHDCAAYAAPASLQLAITAPPDFPPSCGAAAVASYQEGLGGQVGIQLLQHVRDGRLGSSTCLWCVAGISSEPQVQSHCNLLSGGDRTQIGLLNSCLLPRCLTASSADAAKGRTQALEAVSMAWAAASQPSTSACMCSSRCAGAETWPILGTAVVQAG